MLSLARASYWGWGHQIFARDLYEDETGEQLPLLSAEEFLQKYRVKRESLRQLVLMIEARPVFNPEHPSKKEASSCCPSADGLPSLYWHRRAGANNPRSRNVFINCRGTCELYRNRVDCALRSLCNEAIKRKEIAR